MKYKCGLLAAALGLVCLLAGCGSTGAQPSESVPAAPAETGAFGMVSIAETPEQMAEITAAPAPESSAAEELPEASSAEEMAEPEEPVDLTNLAVKSVLCSEYLDRLTYDRADPVFFWRAVGYLVGQVGEQYPEATLEGDMVTIPADGAAPFVTALFGSYEEQYPSLGEENPLIATEYQEQQEIYKVSRMDLSTMDVTMGQMELQEDGTYRCRAELQEDGQTVAVYVLTLTKYPETEGETPLFAYSITGLTAE